MFSLIAVAQALWYISSAASILLLLRLWKEGLISVYRFFSLYLVWDLLTAIILWPVPLRTNLYGNLYFSLQAVAWVLYVLTALELISLVFRNFPGVASFGRRVISWALLGATAIAILSMAVGVNHPPGAPRATIIVLNLFLLERVICVAVLAFLGITFGILLWFPLPLPGNTVRLLAGYSICFAARAISLFSVNRGGFARSPLASVLTGLAVFGCSIYWILRLSKAGERADLTVGPRWSPDEEERLLHQMEAINSSLMRRRRK